jgi:7-carboxy-7-deazaguanine synthase
MRCVWCDSQYTFTGGEHRSIDDVIAEVRGMNCRLVEVTGGEPLAQPNAFKLIRRLCDEGYEVLLETGGYFSIAEVDERASIILDVKCPASGEVERNHWPNLERLRPTQDEVKFVVAERDDWNFTRDVVKRYDLENRCRAVLVSPVWNRIDLQELADLISASGMNVRMQLQMHKTIWGAEARGV